MSLKISACTDSGCRHDENEDFYRAGRLADDTHWVVLCDGMGGVADGGRASAMAVQFLQKEILEKSDSLSSPEEVRDFMLEAAARANSYIYEHSKQGEASAMGTTLVMAIVRGNLAQIVHAGDSRAYLISKTAVKRLTRDHSIVQELLDTGKITLEQAVNHPNKNIITSALGVDAETKIDYDECRLAKGEVLMLCSDGLSNMVSDEDMAQIIRENEFYESSEKLIRRAVEAGGFDNITAVLLGA
ncbi:MAG: Stp1/IreP family PP2C-type Ser/Thr phosphatase [Oscillospiraceae bacterium]|nr:Stp1/IreP family PP2C-type Ser/Thr phosphatase [Oscillospiraceae bacterium]